jgi:hypothetical protein
MPELRPLTVLAPFCRRLGRADPPKASKACGSIGRFGATLDEGASLLSMPLKVLDSEATFNG